MENAFQGWIVVAITKGVRVYFINVGYGSYELGTRSPNGEGLKTSGKLAPLHGKKQTLLALKGNSGAHEFSSKSRSRQSEICDEK